MKKRVMGLLLSLVLLLPALATAADFDWFNNFNLRASADPSGFQAQLSTRFKIGDADVRVVLGNVERPCDAYMVFRLGEMAGQPYGYVLDQYRSRKSTGWGNLAKSLGIKPGSRAFHALKQGDDLYGLDTKGKGGKKDKGKGKNKG